MSKLVPLISSGIAGPLGVLHLPRLWLKASLEAAGKLADGYPGCGQGYDQMVLDGLGLDRDAFLVFIATKPTYIQCEKWVSENGSKVNEASIKELNAAIVGYIHADETRQSILSAAGLPDGDPRDAINLNNLDDWDEFHKATLA
ncbi:DUF5069 domain-containing protein [Haloferula chungangensis]|uniref:DUF5069 domain-containing protein n=1 Tax=Haloferula chungangensis TaxID=1048331 RepID=A0ABW2L7Q7_9BACT